MDPSDVTPRNRLQRLAVAAAIAPVIRNAPEPARRRPILVTDRDGKVIRTTTAIELVEKQLLRQGIEIDTKVTPGVRPKALRCACGMPFLVPPCSDNRRRIPRWCAACEHDRYQCTAVVDGSRCTERLNGQTWTPRNVRRRNGKPPVCKHHYRLARFTREERREIALRRHKATSPEVWRQTCRKAGRVSQAKRTPAQRTEDARKRALLLGPEERREKARKASACLTHEQRCELARKGHETRKARAAQRRG